MAQNVSFRLIPVSKRTHKRLKPSRVEMPENAPDMNKRGCR